MTWYTLILRLCLWCVGLSIPVLGHGQAVEEGARRNIISLSPLELFYKTQAGYERALTTRWSVGSTAAYYPGFQNKYRGWQATTFIRRAFSNSFPIGFYNHAQASLFNHIQQINLTDLATNEKLVISYRGVGAGVGVGIGYRRYLWTTKFGQHLLVDGMIGARYQHRPAFSFNQTQYQKILGLLGEANEADWVFGFSPGSASYGQLMLGYSF